MFKYGLTGIKSSFSKSRILLLAIFAELTIYASVLLKVSTIEMAIILVCIILVFTLEMVNTSIEIICDMIEPNFNIKIKEIKDISAGAVLLSAIGSGIIGLIIFVPRMVNMIC